MENRQNLFCPNKLAYVKGQRPKVDCILCAAYQNIKGVDNLIVYKADNFFVTLNLYPYNPGHLMVVPKRHLETVEDYSDTEILESFKLQNLCFRVLRKLYNPNGFNVGYNIGYCSGASIEHVHLHIVPRYPRELGFMDILNGSRIIVEDPNQTKARMIEVFLKEEY